MNKILILLLMALPVYAQVDKQAFINDNVLSNPGFENGLAGYVESAGTEALVTSGSNLLKGKASATWDSNAATQTYCSPAYTVEEGLKGENGLAEVYIKVPSGTATHEFYVSDGTNDVGARVTIGSDNFVRSNFIFPSTGTVQWCLESVAADEPLIAMDMGYIGRAANITDVSQAEFIGSIIYPATAACEWSSTSPTFADYAADTDCSAPSVDGQVTAPGTKVPHAVLSSLGPGEYRVEVVGQLKTAYSSGTGYCVWEVTDGTTSSGSTAAISIVTSTRNSLSGTIARFSYSTAQSSTTFKLRTKGIGTINSCSVDTINNDLEIRIYKYPLTSQTAIKADQTNRPWTAYTPTFTGFGTPAADDCDWKRQGEDMLIRCTVTSGTMTAVEARVSLPASFTSKSTIPTLSLAGKWMRATISAEAGSVLIEPSVSYVTFSKQNAGQGGFSKLLGTGLIGNGEQMSFTARVPIEGWEETLNAPLIKNSVVSSSEGVIATESARLQCRTTSAIESQNGSWVSSISNRSANECTVTFESGVFSGTPSCIVDWNEDPTVNLVSINIYGESSTGATANCKFQNGASPGDCGDFDLDLICIGPR